MVELEKRPDDGEVLASIFRTIHTIKGTCGFIGLLALQSVAHSAENVLGQMRDRKLKVTPSAISLVLEAVDAIKEQLKVIEETGKELEKDNTNLMARLEALASSADEESGVTMTQPAATAPLTNIAVAVAQSVAGATTATSPEIRTAAAAEKIRRSR